MTPNARVNVLVVGSGGREHAIVWKLAQSPRVRRIYAAPGNPGIARLAQCAPISPTDIAGIVKFAREADCALTVVGPELPLALGIVDALSAEGLGAFGPTRAAARIESSKVYSKSVMDRAGIPTARYQVFDDPVRASEAARAYAADAACGVVIKLDGLAAGKGVVVADGPDEAAGGVRFLAGLSTGSGSSDERKARYIIEERLEGPEASVLCISDGSELFVFPPARDHKRAYDGDEGPNTGGMGAVSPLPDVTDETMDEITCRILRPAIQQLAEDGTPFVGVLFAGIMLTEDGPKVLEFNCRFGDPETQVLLPLLGSDLYDLMEAACAGRIRDAATPAAGAGAHAACVVMASGGYPGPYRTGIPIDIPSDVDEDGGALLFHAGTSLHEGRLVSAGGRVLAVTALAGNRAEALRRAYYTVSRIGFEGCHYRRDIGRTGAAR